jgi:diamine N-acetyltransferase
MIEDEQILLRTPTTSDLTCLLRWENDTRNWAVSDTKAPFSEELMTQFIASDHDLLKHLQLRLMIVLKTSNEVLGTLDLFDYDNKQGTAGLGILIGEKQHRNKGLAKKAIQLLMRKAKEIWQLKTFTASMFVNNRASLSLFNSLDFELLETKKSANSIDIKEDELVMQYTL